MYTYIYSCGNIINYTQTINRWPQAIVIHAISCWVVVYYFGEFIVSTRLPWSTIGQHSISMVDCWTTIDFHG